MMNPEIENLINKIIHTIGDSNLSWGTLEAIGNYAHKALEIIKNERNCDLCVAQGKIWQEGRFYGLICRTHKQPMIILLEHRGSLTEDEELEAEAIRQKRYPELRFRGYIASILDHWHEHLV